MTKYKYKTLAELKDAFDSGNESKALAQGFTLDNDSTTFWMLDPTTKDPENPICIFNGGSPEVLLAEALTLLELPWDYA